MVNLIKLLPRGVVAVIVRQQNLIAVDQFKVFMTKDLEIEPRVSLYSASSTSARGTPNSRAISAASFSAQCWPVPLLGYLNSHRLAWSPAGRYQNFRLLPISSGPSSHSGLILVMGNSPCVHSTLTTAHYRTVRAGVGRADYR